MEHTVQKHKYQENFVQKSASRRILGENSNFKGEYGTKQQRPEGSHKTVKNSNYRENTVHKQYRTVHNCIVNMYCTETLATTVKNLLYDVTI